MTFQGVINYGPKTTPAYLGTQATFDAVLAAPLDGTVFQAVANDGENAGATLYDYTTQYSRQDFSESIAALSARNAEQQIYERNQTNHWTAKNTPNGFGKCNKNFVQLQLCNFAQPIVDPFSTDWDLKYARMLSVVQFAADVSAYGVWFDIENYSAIWLYTAQPLKNAHSFAEYRQRYYDIGYQFAQDVFRISRNLSLMMVFAYDSYATEKLNSPFPADEDNTYGLYKNFLDGLLDGYGDSKTTGGGGNGYIILTTEGTFGVANATNTIRYGLGQINGTFDQALPPPNETYWGDSEYFFDTTVVQHGLAFWASFPSFNPATPGSNHWTPTVWEACLIAAAQNCEWIWVYDPDYTLYPGVDVISGALPTVYVDGIEAARSAGGL